MPKFGNEFTRMAAAVVASIGALNWGAVEFLGEDIIVDTLGMSGDAYTVVILVIFAAGVMTLWNKGVVELLGDPLDG